MINKNLTAHRNSAFSESFDATGQLWTALGHTFELNFAKHPASANVTTLTGALDEFAMLLTFEMDSEETREIKAGSYVYSVFAKDNTSQESTLTLFARGMLFVEDTIFTVPAL